MNIVVAALVVAGIVCLKKAGSLSQQARFSSLMDERGAQKARQGIWAGRLRVLGIAAWIIAGVLWVGTNGF